jgi:hypothetical protein
MSRFVSMDDKSRSLSAPVAPTHLRPPDVCAEPDQVRIPRIAANATPDAIPLSSAFASRLAAAPFRRSQPARYSEMLNDHTR